MVGAEGDTHTCPILNGIANICQQSGNAKPAVQYLTEAARILRAAGRSDDELQLSSQHYLWIAVGSPGGCSCCLEVPLNLKFILSH